MASKSDDASRTCRLCGVHGPLKLSHIVSKAAYRRIPEGPDVEVPERQPVKVTATTSVRTNEQWTERLLCARCEDRFGKWETYAFPLLSQSDGTFPWLAILPPPELPARAYAYAIAAIQLGLRPVP
jgi:5-methylcytosine-specific restriction endonuclease McrA